MRLPYTAKGQRYRLRNIPGKMPGLFVGGAVAQIGEVCSFSAVECRKIRRLNLHETIPGKEESEPLAGWRPPRLNDQRVQVGRGTRRTDPTLFGSDSQPASLTVSRGAAVIADLR
jgi:hypothetical protein